MAGTGFLLRKLASEDNFSGMIRAFIHAAVAAVGPWILIVLVLTEVNAYASTYTGLKEIDEFLSVVIYNLLFSFVLSAPLYVISARYVSDCLYQRDGSPVPGILIASLFLLVVPGLIAAIAFYSLYALMTPFNIFLSIVNFLLLAETWMVMLYLSAIHNYRAITTGWVIGMLLTLFLTVSLGQIHGSPGMLLGMNIGLLLLLVFQIANVLAEYPYPFIKPKNFGFYYHRYKKLFWSGLFLYGGVWIDKVLMWRAPEATTHLNQLTTYPVYDGAMFVSYLSILFLLSLFIFSLETNFYVSYIQYIQHIERNAPLAWIEEEKDMIIARLTENGRTSVVLQGCLSLTIIALTPLVFNWLGINYLELNIFRLGVLGSFFAGLNLVIYIYFSYFDSQENMLKMALVMCFSNGGLTLWSQTLGFPYYGYGYCLSMIFTFLVSGFLLIRFMSQLTYHIFILLCLHSTV